LTYSKLNQTHTEIYSRNLFNLDPTQFGVRAANFQPRDRSSHLIGCHRQQPCQWKEVGDPKFHLGGMAKLKQTLDQGLRRIERSDLD